MALVVPSLRSLFDIFAFNINLTTTILQVILMWHMLLKRGIWTLFPLIALLIGVRPSPAGTITFAPTNETGPTGAIQTYTVAATGVYYLTAAGAQGASGDSNFVGGMGAYVGGDFFLTAGEVLQIAVGQMGTGQGSGANGGGGGGTFIVGPGDTPLLIAGGGGGTRDMVGQNGINGQASQSGTTGSGSSTTGGGAPTNQLGQGGAAPARSWGSGGAGFYSNGANDYLYGTGGSDWANGLTGGSEGTLGFGNNAYGGFGGGGAGNGAYGGGGGGGYSGGDGGRIGGGGGSYNASISDASQFGFSGYETGAGFATITEITSTVPEPSTLILFGLSFPSASLIGWGRRRRMG